MRNAARAALAMLKHHVPFFLCRSAKESDSEAEDLEHAEKLRHVKAVLEEVWIYDIWHLK